MLALKKFFSRSYCRLGHQWKCRKEKQLSWSTSAKVTPDPITEMECCTKTKWRNKKIRETSTMSIRNQSQWTILKNGPWTVGKGPHKNGDWARKFRENLAENKWIGRQKERQWGPIQGIDDRSAKNQLQKCCHTTTLPNWLLPRETKMIFEN